MDRHAIQVVLRAASRRGLATKAHPPAGRASHETTRSNRRSSGRTPYHQTSRLNIRNGLSRRPQSIPGRLVGAGSRQASQHSDYQTPPQQTKTELISSALSEHEASDLVAPVRLPEDPHGVLHKNHPAMSILNNSAIVIQRQIEMMNVFLGYEQANRYVIMNGRGETIGYLAEEDHGFGRAIIRQVARTHRSFTAHVFDTNEREVLRIHRPFSWINSKIRIYDPITGAENPPNGAATVLPGSSGSTSVTQSSPSTSTIPLDQMRIIGEAQQEWAPLRRKYNLFTYRPSSTSTSESSTADASALMTQFARIDSPFLSWDFSLQSASGVPIGSVNRNFSNLAREIFTDTGVYALRMDSVASPVTQQPETTSSETTSPDARAVEVISEPLTLDQRAAMLATAVSIDFDYFSRHSGATIGGFPIPIWFPGAGGAAGEAGAAGGAAGAAGEAGVIGGAGEAAGAVGGAAARGAGAAGTAGLEAGSAGVAGMGTMAGYEAMQRGMGRAEPGQGQADDASPTAQGYGEDGVQGGDYGQQGAPGQGMPEDTWGVDSDPFDKPDAGSSGGGDVEGGGVGDFFSDLF